MSCVVVPSGAAYEGAQGVAYLSGLTRATAGCTGICMAVFTLPPGARSKAHLHHGIESAGYVIDGCLDTYYGVRLEHRVRAERGDFVYIPAEMPHLVVNSADEPAHALVAHTAADDQEGIVLLPELDGLVE